MIQPGSVSLARFFGFYSGRLKTTRGMPNHGVSLKNIQIP